jgi:hypothetical protein
MSIDLAVGQARLERLIGSLKLQSTIRVVEFRGRAFNRDIGKGHADIGRDLCNLNPWKWTTPHLSRTSYAGRDVVHSFNTSFGHFTAISAVLAARIGAAIESCGLFSMQLLSVQR